MTLQNFIYKLTHWENWHYLVKYIPIMPVWLWYCIRARSFWFFTASNPSLTFGGFDGESKKEMYEQLPVGSFPRSIYVSPEISFTQLELLIETNNYTFPFAVKPDVGRMGYMFRVIRSREELRNYHRVMKVQYIVQSLSNYPVEVSVFYYRFPFSSSGCITGFVKKESLQVIGNGVSTLETLMKKYKRIRFRKKEMWSKHAEHLNKIVSDKEVYYLSHALNLSRGGRLVSLAHEIDDRLLKVFDGLSNYTGFFYGRYDIKCENVEDLKRGNNFCILEFNGSGAEPHHAYGNNNTLLQAYAIFIKHWSILFEISKYNSHQGISYWRFKKGLRFFKAANLHFKHLKELDRITTIEY